MATPFTDIYARAIFRFADYEFLKQDIETREGVLEKYLISAKTEFQRVCKTDLGDYDLELKQFNQTLDDEVIEILSLGIAFYWLSYKALNSELLKNVLNSKDYYYYSPANLLKEVQTLRKTLRNEFNSKMRQHSYNDSTIGTLKA
ncbi:MAG: hypothetical protein IKL29_03725 [Bacteroidaceae bacterium]|nr:hypothetical protein [Bacteroidaceae bacterium]